MATIGDIIEVSERYVRVKENYRKANLEKLAAPIRCVYLGESCIFEGEMRGEYYETDEGVDENGENWQPSYLSIKNVVKCSVVQRIDGRRWLKPFRTKLIEEQVKL